MIFVTGPMFAGKQEYICRYLHKDFREFASFGIRDVQDLAAEAGDLEELAGKLSSYEVVIASEIGGGIVPTDPAERYKREQAGRLACLLADRADMVIRVCCGLGQVLKKGGEV